MEDLTQIRLDLFDVDPITLIQLEVEIQELLKKLLREDQYDIVVFE